MNPTLHQHHHHAPVMKAKKGKAAQAALNRLNAFLNAAEPEPVFWLTRLWGDQQKAITYKELQEAIDAGYLDQKTLAAWQQDYANFVNEKLKPIWTAAMEAGAADLTAKHPDFFFDPMAEGILNWTSTHGAEWVTNITDEAREAMTAMIERATTGEWTSDELARAIRPTIGLTKPQALANLNYYEHMKAALLKNNPTMKQETAARQAREAAGRYAGRQHRQRAYTIATTELAFAYNKGADDGVKQAIQQGFMGKTVRIWSTAYDDGVCPICSALEGQQIDMEDEFNFKGASLYAGQKQTPPAHPRCRCAVLYKEIEPPKAPAEPPADTPTWEPTKAQEPPEPPAPDIPKAIAVPDTMTDNGPVHMGNTGVMHASTDPAGGQWLFKPAQSKSGVKEPFRAYAQEAGYKVQAIVDPDTAVPVGTGELGGKFGAFQKRVQTITGDIDYKAWQSAGGPIPEGAAAQFQREHVTDWLLGNFDSHGGNFIVDDAGRLVGIDKEQAFKYIKQPGSKAMSYAYHPNKGYGETEPIYNTLYRRFAKGEIDLDLQDTLTYIKRVEAIPDAEYREIFRDYAESLCGKGKAADDLLDAIVERKTTLRETYRAFYSDLLTERTGKATTFTWADEVAPAAKQPLAALTHSADTLKKMNVAELKQMAKQQGIPYYNKFNKGELIDALTDPVKAAEISSKTKAKLLDLEATRPQRMAAMPQKPKPPKMPKGVTGASDVFGDMAVVPRDRIGAAISSDKGMVEGLNLTARRITVDGQEVYEIAGKLTESARAATDTILTQQGQLKDLKFERADDTLALMTTSPINMGGVHLKARTLEDAGSTFELYTHTGSASEYWGMSGYFRLRVPVTTSGAGDAKAATNILQRLGLGDLTETPTKAAEETVKKARVIWQHAPNRVKELSGLTGADLDGKLDTILSEEGLGAIASRLKMEKVFDGYQTYVDADALKEYEAAGLRYVWAGVERGDSVVAVLKSPGLMSTNARSRYGLDFTGESPSSDMRKGGSDSVFTRIGIKTSATNKPRFDNSLCGSYYRILIDPAEMARTDWYAYESDSFGTTKPGRMAVRPSPLTFIQDMTNNYCGSNEIMFRQGIPKEHFIGISCQTERHRAELLDKLRQAGITEINGIPIEKFVEVGQEI